MDRSPLDALDEEARAALRERAHPRWLDPMLATLTKERFSDPGWIFERKLDGVRVLVFRGPDGVRLLSRNRKKLDDTYPELVDAVEAEDADDFVADGEIVAFRGAVTSFSRLQGRMQIKDPDEARKSRIKVYLYLFDLLHLDGHDTRALPLRTRKALLRKALAFDDPLRFLPHRNEEGEASYEEACAKGWEGLIAKRAAAPYQAKRSRDWLKFKCVARQELVVGGYTDPEGARSHFGALLVGYYDDGDLRYAGRVGTGYDEDTLARVGKKLSTLARETSPFDDPPPARGVHWVSPKLVVEVAFTEWTGAGRLRHPRFVGLRPDKDAREVVREEA